ncbi:hypothetical protein [Burkholderia guangdongensis]|uniref:hypothetical protein n=1 Tax=Burkholderia guangdongensis TaxID=1792500 RepID=UPI0015CC9E21|nr:hypothetical protein [Burkholderia guangdongensis]
MKRIAIAATFGFAALLSGCALSSTPVSFAESKAVPASMVVAFQKPTATDAIPILLKRDAGTATVCRFQVSIDGTKSLFIGPAEKTTLFLSPGQHVITVEPVSTDTLMPGVMSCHRSPREFPMAVDQHGLNRFRFSTDDNNEMSFAPTATD